MGPPVDDGEEGTDLDGVGSDGAEASATGLGATAPEVTAVDGTDGLDAGDLDADDLDADDLDAEDLDAPEEAVSEDELVEDEVERLAAKAPSPRRPGALRRLYRGETSFDFVGRRRWWFTISAVVILAGVASLGIRGLNLGITFKGGEAWTVKAPGVSQSQALSVAQSAGLNQPTVELLGRGSAEEVRVTADLNGLTSAQRSADTTHIVHALAKMAKVPADDVSVTTVGPTWGSQVTERAIIALIVFLIAVAVYISIRFEPKMAASAFVALLHDLLVTAGVYSLAGFQVTPDTVIAVLTILGYSLYDTVVVFDRVRDNSKGLGASGRMTYTDMVNLSMNQTLARSINTSLVAILPVLSVLLIGAELLGATTLQTYGLALCVGLLSGAYSSIFIASPTLAMLKEREPRYVAVRQRVQSKGERLGLLTPSAAAALVGASAVGGSVRASRAQSQGMLRPGQARPGRSARTQQGARGGVVREVPPPASAEPQTTATAAGNGAARPAGNGAARPAGAGGGARSARAPGPRPGQQRRPAQRARKGGKGKRRR